MEGVNQTVKLYLFLITLGLIISAFDVSWILGILAIIIAIILYLLISDKIERHESEKFREKVEVMRQLEQIKKREEEKLLFEVKDNMRTSHTKKQQSLVPSSNDQHDIKNKEKAMSKEIPFYKENQDTYFEGYSALKDVKEANKELSLQYLRPSDDHFFLELIGLSELQNDKEIEKYFPSLYGESYTEGLITYLYNTTQVTALGIGFAYLMKKDNKCVGIVKVTSPAHNRVPNNFNHWLIDYTVIPKERGKGYATYSITNVLKIVQQMGAKEIFAMVDCENLASIHILEKCGFYETHLLDIGANSHTGNKCLLYRKMF